MTDVRVAERGPAPNQAREHFVQARLAAHRLMVEAARLAGLPDLERAQADAIAGLSGLRLHRIIGEADAADFLALRDDLEAIAAKIDPLVAAIGAEAAGGSHHIEADLFESQLATALDGNATFNLAQAAERLAEARVDTHDDHRRRFERAAE